MRLLWQPGRFERGGNTKTHGIVRGDFIVHDNLPPELRHGIYAQAAPYPAWVRFSGPGPYITPDIDDVGFMSIAIKLMRVPGPKLMDDEKVHPGYVWRLHANLRHSGLSSECAIADGERKKRANILLSQSPSAPCPGSRDAVALDQNPERPV